MKKSKQRRLSQTKNPRKPFIDHLAELRLRFFCCILFFLLASAAIYPFNQVVLSWLLRPLHNTVYYTSPTGGLDLIIQLCLFFGLLLSLPVIIYNCYCFVEPILPQQSRWLAIIIVTSSFFLLCCGVSLSYFVSLPAALNFLGNFESKNVTALITTNEYFSFVTHYLLGFGLFFQLPLVLLLWNYISPLKSSLLLNYSRYVIVLSAIIAAVLTPTPDPINQAMMAVPLIVLYYLSVLLIWGINRNKRA